jgi:hypothetical protein
MIVWFWVGDHDEYERLINGYLLLDGSVQV